MNTQNTELVKVGIVRQEWYPVFELVTIDDRLREKNVMVPAEFIDRYNKALTEFEAVQSMLIKYFKQGK